MLRVWDESGRDSRGCWLSVNEVEMLGLSWYGTDER